MDEHFLFLLNQRWTHPVLDWFLGTLSCLDFWVPVFVCAALWLILRRGLRGQTLVALALFGITANEYGLSQPLKSFTKKPRPHEALANVRRVNLAPAKPRFLALFKPLAISRSGPPPTTFGPKSRRSFPSAHVMNATTLALLLTLSGGSSLWLLLPPLMAWSRVYTGAHWPSDVTSSLLLGSLWTLLYLVLLETLWQRWVPQKSPHWIAQLPRLILPKSLASIAPTPLPPGSR
jgi:undecaprenyl-diphosphatase